MAMMQAGSAELVRAGHEMEESNQQLQNEAQQLHAAVDAVDWQGVAKAAFVKLMGAFAQDTKQLNDALTKISEEIVGSAKAMDAQEANSSQSLSAIASTLDG